MPLSDRNYRSLEYEDEGLNYGGEDTTVGGVLPTVNNDTTVGGLSALQTGKPLDSSISPLDYTQVGTQLFNRALAQPEINYLQSLYGQDVDPTELRAIQGALAPNQNIQNLYQTVLGRQADPFGQMYWSQVFGSDISPEEEAAFRQAAQAEISARAAPSGGALPVSQNQAQQTAIDTATVS